MSKQLLFPDRYPDFCVPVFTGLSGATAVKKGYRNSGTEPWRYTLHGARDIMEWQRRRYDRGASHLKPNSIVRVYLKHE
jgi:hypothetical protein